MKKNSVILLVLMIFVTSCRKDFVPYPLPSISECNVTPWATSAQIEGSYSYASKLSGMNLLIGQKADLSDAEIIKATLSDNHSFSVMATGLARLTTYYYALAMTNAMGEEVRGEVGSFTTNSTTPTVTTTAATNITHTSANVGGNVTDDGGATVTARGVKYGTSQNNMNKIVNASSGGTGTFTVKLTGLKAGQTYYYKAFATNSNGTEYGEVMNFNTTTSSIPEGALSGVFSVSPTKQVYFSKGNLKYNGSTSTWSFEENQWDCVTTHNGTTWGHFGWSTSATNYGMNTSTYNGDYSGDFVDWGNNTISNADNTGNKWKTLSSAEWTYLLNERIVNGGTGDGYTYRRVTCGTIYGMLIFHDDYTGSVPASGGTITTASLSSEYAGCVFLPAAGCRNNTSCLGAGILGCYWSSTYRNSSLAYGVDFNSGNVDPGFYGGRGSGHSVRLVYVPFEN